MEKFPREEKDRLFLRRNIDCHSFFSFGLAAAQPAAAGCGAGRQERVETTPSRVYDEHFSPAHADERLAASSSPKAVSSRSTSGSYNNFLAIGPDSNTGSSCFYRSL